MLAYALGKGLDLNAASFFCQGLTVGGMALEGVQGPEKPHQEAAGRSKACATRDIADGGGLEAVLYAVGLQGGADQIMAKVGGGWAGFWVWAMQDDAAMKAWSVGGNMDVLIQAHGKDKPAPMAVIALQVGAASAQGDAQGGPGGDHGLGRTLHRTCGNLFPMAFGDRQGRV